MRARITSHEHGKAIRMLGTAQDVTGQDRLQAQVVPAQKMEAAASLAGGIAHEFNNALVRIMGNIDLLEMHLPDDKNTKKYVASMKASAWRMARLADQLLAYARGGKYQREAISLTKFVGDALPSLRQVMDPSVRLQSDPAVDILKIEADPSQLQMVVSAILSNAREAVDGKGHIQITTYNVETDEVSAKKHSDLEPGRYACLSVEDDGKGMDQETITGIFEPFYTKKSQGRGLGMAAVYGIIKNHDGWISVESELCKGTIVRIYLPAVEVEPKGMEK